MGRQRTINDQAFWRSPRLANATQEDKIALLHLLTCPDSNITGCFTLIPRIAGAEIGWTAEQWLQVIERLECMDLVFYEKESQFVWVKIWWQHHAARQVTGPKLRGKTVRDLENIPHAWRAAYLQEFVNHCSQEQVQVLLAEMSESQRIWYGYHIDVPAGGGLANDNYQPQSLTATTTFGRRDVDDSGLSEEIKIEVLRALQDAQKKGVLKHPPKSVISEIARQYQSGRENKPRSAYALTVHLAQYLAITSQSQSMDYGKNNTASKIDINEFKNRCFSRGGDGDSMPVFYKIFNDGLFDEFTVSPKNIERRTGYLNIDLVRKIRQGLLIEIPQSELEKIEAKQGVVI